MLRVDYDWLRHLSHPATSVAFVALIIDFPDSRVNYVDSERLELHHFCRGTAFLVDEVSVGIGTARKQREDYDRLRPLSYPAESVVPVSFSIDSHDSRGNYTDSERLELHRFCRAQPFLWTKQLSESNYSGSERTKLCCFCQGTSFHVDEVAVGDGKAKKQRGEYDLLWPLSYPARAVVNISFSIGFPEAREN
nr:uncharacterized protein LOC119176751 [Rhipicephalus microplus]